MSLPLFLLAGGHTAGYEIRIRLLDAPELTDFSETELCHLFVRVNQDVQVGMEALRCVCRCDLEPNLDVVVWVRPNYKVDVVPVSQ